MSESEYELPSMSRREAMSAGSAAAVAVGSGLLAQSLIGAVRAQTTEPRISLGPDWVIDDDPDGNGHLVVEYTPNGNRYVFQEDGALVTPAVSTDQSTTAGFTGTPVWKEESGSPYTATGSNSANSINPSSLDSFDSYKIYFKAADNGGSSNNLEMQVGGDTGSNYNEVLLDGTVNTSQTEWANMAVYAGSDTATGWIILNDVRDTIGMKNLHGTGNSGVVTGGRNTGVSWPLSQFTLQRGADTDWEVRVWGRDI